MGKIQISQKSEIQFKQVYRKFRSNKQKHCMSKIVGNQLNENIPL